jgi:hypothetical protein
VLPATSWAEHSGTYVNAKGMRQLSEKALEPLGAARRRGSRSPHSRGARLRADVDEAEADPRQLSAGRVPAERRPRTPMSTTPTTEDADERHVEIVWAS